MDHASAVKAPAPLSINPYTRLLARIRACAQTVSYDHLIRSTELKDEKRHSKIRSASAIAFCERDETSGEYSARAIPRRSLAPCDSSFVSAFL
jgi:hypothetical protein